MANRELDSLPRLPAAAMAPCIRCQRQLLETGLPLFLRIEIKRCAIDGVEVRKHVGLAMAMGGGADAIILADVMGAHKPPVVVLDELPVINVCNDCQPQTTAEWMMLGAMALAEAGEHA